MHNNEFRRGDTFSWSGEATLRDQDGKPMDMTGATGESQLRQPDGTKIADLSVQYGDGSINIRYFGDTSAWPLCKAQMDVKFTMPDGSKTSTNKTTIEIVDGVTR